MRVVAGREPRSSLRALCLIALLYAGSLPEVAALHQIAAPKLAAVLDAEPLESEALENVTSVPRVPDRVSDRPSWGDRWRPKLSERGYTNYGLVYSFPLSFVAWGYVLEPLVGVLLGRVSALYQSWGEDKRRRVRLTVMRMLLVHLLEAVALSTIMSPLHFWNSKLSWTKATMELGCMIFVVHVSFFMYELAAHDPHGGGALHWVAYLHHLALFIFAPWVVFSNKQPILEFLCILAMCLGIENTAGDFMQLVHRFDLLSPKTKSWTFIVLVALKVVWRMLYMTMSAVKLLEQTGHFVPPVLATCALFLHCTYQDYIYLQWSADGAPEKAAPQALPSAGAPAEKLVKGAR